MAYIVSPYAGAAEFPSDNMPAQLLQQGLQAGYARRMKEMEQKMKLQEEGKKKLDEAYKYAKLDLKNIDPIYHNELKAESDALAKNMTEAYARNPASFAYNTDIAEQIRKLNEKKGAYEQYSGLIKLEKDAKRKIEDAGKMDVASTDFGTLYEEYTNPETSPETKKEIESKWRDKFTGANLYTAKPRVAPYTPLEEFGKAIQDTVKASDEKGDVTKEQYLTAKDIIRQKLNENPNNIPYYAKFYNVAIDQQNPKKAEDELVEIINEKQNPLNIKRDEPRTNFYPSGGFYETKNVSIGEGTSVLPSTSKAESEWEKIASKLEEAHNEGIKKRGLDPLDYPYDEERFKKQYINNWLQTHKTPTTFHSVEYKGTAENPNAPILDFNVDGVVYRGSPQGFEVDKNKKITHISIYEEPKLDKRGDVVSGGNITTIKATPEAWEKYSNAYGLSDFVRRYNLIKPSSATSATKESVSKETNKSVKKEAGRNKYVPPSKR